MSTSTIDENKLLKEVIPLAFLESPDYTIVKTITQSIHFNLDYLNFESLSIIEIQKEFVRFFRVGGKDYIAPYESCWILKKFPDEPFCVPRLYSKVTEEIQKIYDNLHITPLPHFSEPPDHIAFELSVYFSIKEAGIKESDEYIKIFINEHFIKWVPEYLNRLAGKNGQFYPYIAMYLLKKI